LTGAFWPAEAISVDDSSAAQSGRTQACGAGGVERRPRRRMRDSAQARPRRPALVLDLPAVQETRYARRVITQATRFAFDRLMSPGWRSTSRSTTARPTLLLRARVSLERASCDPTARLRAGAETWRSTRAPCRRAREGALAQRPIPTCWDRCSSFPSVCNEGATMTSAFWNSFMSPYPQVARLVRRAPNRFSRPSF
jgi:hypothetical protein